MTVKYEGGILSDALDELRAVAAGRALRDAAREARKRGDIGKDGGPEVWTWLEHRAGETDPSSGKV